MNSAEGILHCPDTAERTVEAENGCLTGAFSVAEQKSEIALFAMS